MKKNKKVTFAPYNYHYLNKAEVLDHSFSVYKRSLFVQILGHLAINLVSVVALVPLIAIFIYFSFSIDPSLISSLTTANDVLIEIFRFFFQLLPLILFGGVSFLYTTSLTSTFGVLISEDAFMNWRTGIGQSILMTLKRTPILLFFSLIKTVVFILYMLLVIMIFIMFIYLFSSWSSPNFSTLGLLGVVVCFLAVLALGIISYFDYLGTVIAQDNTTVKKAFQKTSLHLKDDFWPTLFILMSFNFASFLAFNMIFMAITLVGGIINASSGLDLLLLLSSMSYVTSSISQLLNSLLVFPMKCTFQSVLVLNKKIKHEGLAVNVMIDNLYKVTTG